MSTYVGPYCLNLEVQHANLHGEGKERKEKKKFFLTNRLNSEQAVEGIFCFVFVFLPKQYNNCLQIRVQGNNQLG